MCAAERCRYKFINFLVSRNAWLGCLSSLAASALASSSSLSGATTRLANPYSTACWALMRSPVKISSFARNRLV
ncbi:hypothetical protein D3C85_1773120 [compost metagenome]